MKRKPAITIGAHEAGKPLIDLLSGRFTYHSRDEWMDFIEFGQLLLNQLPAQPTTILAAGDILEYNMPESPEPSVDTHFSIIFEDGELLAVNKPGNLPCHPAGRYFNHTLWALLKEQFDLPYLSLINRLDRETSGIVLLAKNPEAIRTDSPSRNEPRNNAGYPNLIIRSSIAFHVEQPHDSPSRVILSPKGEESQKRDASLRSA